MNLSFVFCFEQFLSELVFSEHLGRRNEKELNELNFCQVDLFSTSFRREKRFEWPSSRDQLKIFYVFFEILTSTVLSFSIR